jgi:hypothetical protein
MAIFNFAAHAAVVAALVALRPFVVPAQNAVAIAAAALGCVGSAMAIAAVNATDNDAERVSLAHTAAATAMASSFLVVLSLAAAAARFAVRGVLHASMLPSEAAPGYMESDCADEVAQMLMGAGAGMPQLARDDTFANVDTLARDDTFANLNAFAPCDTFANIDALARDDTFANIDALARVDTFANMDVEMAPVAPQGEQYALVDDADEVNQEAALRRSASLMQRPLDMAAPVAGIEWRQPPAIAAPRRRGNKEDILAALNAEDDK